MGPIGSPETSVSNHLRRVISQKTEEFHTEYGFAKTSITFFFHDSSATIRYARLILHRTEVNKYSSTIFLFAHILSERKNLHPSISANVTILNKQSMFCGVCTCCRKLFELQLEGTDLY